MYNVVFRNNKLVGKVVAQRCQRGGVGVDFIHEDVYLIAAALPTILYPCLVCAEYLGHGRLLLIAHLL